MIRPVLDMIGCAVVCGAILAGTKRAEIAHWLAVRLLAYRDAVAARKRGVASWERSLGETAELEKLTSQFPFDPPAR